MSRTFTIRDGDQLERLFLFMRAQLKRKPLQVVVDFWAKPRTTNANRRLWKLHGLASQECGMSPEELHRDACGEYFGWHEEVVMGRTVRTPNRTTTWPDVLGSDDFTRFMEWRESQYAEFLGVWLDR